MLKPNVTKCVLICFVCSGIQVSTADYSCSNHFVLPSWNFSTSERPAYLHHSFNNLTNEINVQLEDLKKDFCLTLFAVPFVKDESQCPFALDKSLDVRRHENSVSSSNYGEGNRTSSRFDGIFTGCYFFVMSSMDSNDTWQLGPKFYKTDYSYRDTKLRIEKFREENDDEWMKLDEMSNSRSLDVLLKIPLECMVVRSALYEMPTNNADAYRDIAENDVRPLKEFTIAKIPGSDSVNVTNAPILSVTHILLDVIVEENSWENSGWIALLRWKNLLNKPGKYYLRNRGDYETESCRLKYGNDTLKTWRLVDEDNWTNVGEIPFPNSPWVLSVGVLYFVGLPLMMAFLMVFYAMRK